jgi:DNA-binding transcriptional ArsR family regulator
MLAIRPKKSTRVRTVKPKSARQMERHIKGVANHRRIDILFLVADHKGMSVDVIAAKLKCNMKTISMHLITLEHAGLIRKRKQGLNVVHELSPYGTMIHKFLTVFQYS